MRRARDRCRALVRQQWAKGYDSYRGAAFYRHTPSGERLNTFADKI
jgi:hypothetical protein